MGPWHAISHIFGDAISSFSLEKIRGVAVVRCAARSPSFRLEGIREEQIQPGHRGKLYIFTVFYLLSYFVLYILELTLRFSHAPLLLSGRILPAGA